LVHKQKGDATPEHQRHERRRFHEPIRPRRAKYGGKYSRRDNHEAFAHLETSAAAETEMESESERPNPGGDLAAAVASTEFPDGFSHIHEARAEMAEQVEQYKDAEHLANQAKADVAQLKAAHEARQRIREADKKMDHKTRNNLNTIVGSQSGVFDRMPEHFTLAGYGRGHARGGNAKHNWTPARRLVPNRLQKLEDDRKAARRRKFNRGNIASTYHKQLFGKRLGVAKPIMPATAPVDTGILPPPATPSFVQMGEQTVYHDAPALRELPPM